MINTRGPLIKSEESLTSFGGFLYMSFAFLVSSFCISLQNSSGVTSLRKKLCALGFLGNLGIYYYFYLDLLADFGKH